MHQRVNGAFEIGLPGKGHWLGVGIIVRNHWKLLVLVRVWNGSHFILWNLVALNFLFRTLLRLWLCVLTIRLGFVVCRAEFVVVFFELAGRFFFFLFNGLVELDDFEIEISVFFLLNLNSWKEFYLVHVEAHLLDGCFHLVSERYELLLKSEITLSPFVDIIENRWIDFMDPHGVFFGVIEVVNNEAKEDSDVSVEFVFYFVFCSVWFI